jgi:nicotinate phosphoribosyltransferase
MIIQSLLDTDLYKFTMMQAVLHHYPAANVKYRFKCRTPGYKFTKKQLQEIRTQVKYFCSLSFNDKELAYLGSLRYLTPDFIQFLRLYRPNMKYIRIDNQDECELNIEIEGPWLHTILFEVPILAIISEVVMGSINPYPSISDVKDPLKEKILLLQDHGGAVQFADFGTRRRYSSDIQKLVVRTLDEKCLWFIGTSNVQLAYSDGLMPIGTMAHEWVQAHQALGMSLIDSQKAAFETWVQEYRGDLGIALTDTIGVDAFLRDFDLYFSKLFDGVRHDSGDPYAFGYKIIAHYSKQGIDPKTKTIVFSDGLTFDKMLSLYDTFAHHINVSFGIGTNLTNDVGKNKPLSIVIKMVECNGRPVAKLSDSEGKTMCEDESYVYHLKSVFGKE